MPPEESLNCIDNGEITEIEAAQLRVEEILRPIKLECSKLKDFKELLRTIIKDYDPFCVTQMERI